MTSALICLLKLAYDSGSYVVHVQDLDKKPGHDAGLSLSHLVISIYGKCIHCCGAFLPHLCHHGGAALWGAFLDLQRHLSGKQGGSRRVTAQRMRHTQSGMPTIRGLKTCSHSSPWSIYQEEHHHRSNCKEQNLMAVQHIMHPSGVTACMLPAAQCVFVVPCSACLYSCLSLLLLLLHYCLERKPCLA